MGKELKDIITKFNVENENLSCKEAYMNNKNYSRAKVLTLIPVIIFVVIAISLVLSTILEGPTARGEVYTVFAFIGVVGLFLAPLPCLIVSVLGTMFAAKAKKEGVGSAVIFLILGVIEILVYVVGVIIAVMMFIGGMSV